MNIRPARREGFDHIWPIFHEIVEAGDTFGYPRDVLFGGRNYKPEQTDEWKRKNTNGT